ncbi:hypothetical protein R3P38DRAFT_3206203 [Favolaschia claudopus]|uniref:Uncharacterized protein n=1 Tax=Favolaschia claudopus TaxID=2862362 RepID=A0AAW0AM22_9AGAR
MATTEDPLPVPRDLELGFLWVLLRKARDAIGPASETSGLMAFLSRTFSRVLEGAPRQYWDHMKGVSAVFVSNAAIATFLAAVQSQIVALSYQENTSRVAVACNALGFAGVLFDGSSGFFALSASTKLERNIAIIEHQLSAIDDASPRQLAQISHREFERAYADGGLWSRIHKKVTLRMQTLQSQRLSQDVEDETTNNAPLLRALWLPWEQVQFALALGNLAMLAMKLGTLCFFGSVICLAMSTQPRAVWIVAVVVTGSVIFASFAAVLYFAAGHFLQRWSERG